jgi:hypothetical protein
MGRCCAWVVVRGGPRSLCCAVNLDGRLDIRRCVLGTQFGFDSCCAKGESLDLLTYMYVENTIVARAGRVHQFVVSAILR